MLLGLNGLPVIALLPFLSVGILFFFLAIAALLRAVSAPAFSSYFTFSFEFSRLVAPASSGALP